SCSARSCFAFFFSSRRRHTRSKRDWSSDVCSSDLSLANVRDFVEGNLAAGADHLFVFVEGGDREVLSHLDRHPHVTAVDADTDRSEERRVGKEGRTRVGGEH